MTLANLTIKSHQGDYTAEFPNSFQELIDKLLAVPNPALVIDENVERLYRNKLAPLFKKIPFLIVQATEEEKSFVGVTKVVNWLQSLDANKQTTMITIGGGIVQDISAFSAHIYYRGIRWVFVPTTLLSMSDSSIGAKCGINLNSYKNQLGSFHSPSRVLICTPFTETLTDNDIASGYGEILKLMFTGSETLLNSLESAVEKQGLRNPEMAQLLRASLEVKKEVIEIDEYEKDLRRILNYGHTFGHALESLTHHEIPHGLAVAWGMDLVNYISVQRGLLAEADFQRMRKFIQRYLPFRLSNKISATQLIERSRRDKKVAEGKINLILAEKPGSLKIVKTAFDDRLETEIKEYAEQFDVYKS